MHDVYACDWTYHLHLLPCEAALLVEGAVFILAVQNDLVTTKITSRADERLDQPVNQGERGILGVSILQSYSLFV